MNIRFVSVVALAASGVVVGSAVAQRPSLPRALAVETGKVTNAENAASVMVRTVTVKLDDVSVRQAIDALAESADVRIQYKETTLQHATRLVTLHAARMPLGVALDRVLAGTLLQPVPAGNDLITIKVVVADPQLAQGTLVGKLLNAKTRQPVANASVQVDGEPVNVTVGNDGAFRLTLSAGEHRVGIRAVGFSRKVETVTIREGESITLTIMLDANASVLDEVVVTGTVVATARKEIPTPITVITGDELEKRGITRIEQLFRGEVPGLLALERGTSVYSTSDVGLGISSAIYSRGSASLDGSANPIKTYVDGVELVDPSYLGTIDPRSIEKIEIVTGPQAATIYGSGAMGGVMQIFTRRGSVNDVPEVSLAIKYGMLQNSFSNGITPAHNDAIAVRGGTSRELMYSGNLSYDYIGQWQPKLFSRRYSASLGATHARDWLTVSTAFSVLTSKQGTFNGTFSSQYGLYQLLTDGDHQYNGSFGSAREFASQRVSESSNQNASLNVDIHVASTWQMGVTLGKTQNTLKLKPLAPNFSYGQVGSDTLFRTQDVRGQRFTWGVNSSHFLSWPALSSTWSVGVNGSLGDQVSIRGGLANTSDTRISGDPDLAGIPGFEGPYVTTPMNDHNWGTFGTWRVGFFNQLYTTLGLRAEQNPRYGRKVKFDFTPTNGLTYTLEYGDVSVKLMGSYGRATRPPRSDQRLERIGIRPGYEPAQIYWLYANPDLRPEYSRGPQGGMEVYIGSLMSLTLNHYYQNITDLLQQVVVDSTEFTRLSDGVKGYESTLQWRNVSKIRQVGWEGSGAVQLGPVSVHGTYTWSDSKIVQGIQDYLTQYIPVGQAFSNLPAHYGNLSIGYGHGMTSLTLATNWIGQRIGSFTDTRIFWGVYQARHRMYAQSGNSNRLYNGTTGGLRVDPGYVKADLSGSHRLTPQLTLTLNVVNIGNTIDSDLSDLSPSLGRQTTLGFSYHFAKR